MDTISDKDRAVLSAVLNRFNSYRLPRVLAMRTRVLDGERLGETELQFLELLVRDMRKLRPLCESSPRYKSIYTQAVNLYAEVTAQALENERLNNAR